MKNISIILNVVLLLAVAVLYYLHFSGRTTSEEVSGRTAGPISPTSIAYINSDTLLKNYDFFKVAADQLEGKKDGLQAEYENRARGLETEIQSFQRNAQNMTIAQARAIEEDLVKKQQNLMRYQETLAQSLAQDEAKVNNELYDRVSEYLREYGKSHDFQLVLTYQKGSGVVYANDSLNITEEVIKGLNEAYQSETKAAADSTASN
ncbi:MAG: OmpH family outer membrane protein [Cyclobacteriaceae bacterium]|nr:OmpH family outer membrane protein [Cyclobacteriaceae bacterium]